MVILSSSEWPGFKMYFLIYSEKSVFLDEKEHIFSVDSGIACMLYETVLDWSSRARDNRDTDQTSRV